MVFSGLKRKATINRCFWEVPKSFWPGGWGAQQSFLAGTEEGGVLRLHCWGGYQYGSRLALPIVGKPGLVGFGHTPAGTNSFRTQGAAAMTLQAWNCGWGRDHGID